CFGAGMTPLAALWFDGPMWMLGLLLFLGWSGTGAFPLFMGVVPAVSVSRSLAASSVVLVVARGELIGRGTMPALDGRIVDATGLAAPVVVAAFCAVCAGVAALFREETGPRKVARP